ncbi:alpha/beta hydrolase family protein [Marixanthomonas ophiurae]|uniref:Alpha/beta fold hydrolase n=1 Tax=Marixanthomonas ophiurae TaxID=387659 RepID=A0A3E1QAT4_9FLAO|nr:alpha/beta fold hydrolase [Marixanthomonas ophiurae]RFN59245.1 alpha/beta fold hydrolase [Marixanthomonas ophiurae]
MMIEQNNILHRENKKPIVYDVYYNENQKPKPVVIFCHGYKGFKDWGAWHLVAEAFAKAGFFFIKFNFSHNGGTVDEPIDFPDLEAFAENNYTKELDDLETVIEYFATTKHYMLEADVKKISLVGHSRGGGIVLIKAEENDKVKNIVTWAGVSDYKTRFKEGTEDFKENENRLTIQRAVEHLETPHLIIHGSDDPTVSVKEAESMHKWNPKSTLKIIEDTNHVFGAKHPWNDDKMPSALKKVVKATIDFIK